MEGPRYPAARSFAARLEDHFARHAATGVPGAAPPAPRPDAEAIEAMIDAGFWASLQREEGHAPEISLAFLPAAQAVRPLLFATPLPLGARALARLAPAVERPGIHLGVWREKGELCVWGTTRTIPSFCFVLEVLGPGLLVVKHRTREESAKFRNVAVFEGEQVKVLSPEALGHSEYPDLLASLLGTENESDDDSVEVLLRLAVSMRAHKRGGRSWSSPRVRTPGGDRSCIRFPTRSSLRSPSSRTSSGSRPERTPPGPTGRSAGWWTRSPA